MSKYKVVKMKPSEDRHSRGKRIYPLNELAAKGPGYGFEVPANDPRAQKNNSGGCSVASSAHSFAIRNNIKIVTERTDNGSMKVIHVKNT